VTATITCPTAGTLPYRTTDGTTPTTSSPQSGTATFNASGTLAAICAGNGYSASAVATATYTVTITAGASCASTPLRSTGTKYYYCDCQGGAASGCVAGNDANAGTSPTAPRRTLSAAIAQFNAMNAGDTIALCRGGAWNEYNLGALFNQRCRTDSNVPPAANNTLTCDFRDDQGAVAAGRWSTASDPILDSTSGNPAPGMFTIWNTDYSYVGYRFWNLNVKLHTRSYESSRAFYVVGTQDNFDFCNITASGGYLAFQVNGTHHALRQSHIFNFGWHAFLGGGNGTVIDSNWFYNNGDQTISPDRPGQPHTIYFISTPTIGARITNNWFHTGPDGEVYQGVTYGQCRGVMLILREDQDGTVVENNYLEGWGPYGCGGIMASSSYSDGKFNHLVFNQNRVVWANNGGLGGPASLLGVNCTQNSTFTNNVLESGTAGTVAMQVPEQDGSQCVWSSTANTVRNNSVRITGSGSTGISMGQVNGGNSIAENNAVWVPSGSTCISVQNGTASGHPFTITSYPSVTTNTAGNYCVANGSAPTVIWQAAASGDYRPVNPGPLVGAANQTYYAPTAIGSIPWNAADPGSTRTLPIDIGAYQH
jgi:hypothetical protein